MSGDATDPSAGAAGSESAVGDAEAAATDAAPDGLTDAEPLRRAAVPEDGERRDWWGAASAALVSLLLAAVLFVHRPLTSLTLNVGVGVVFLLVAAGVVGRPLLAAVRGK